MEWRSCSPGESTSDLDSGNRSNAVGTHQENLILDESLRDKRLLSEFLTRDSLRHIYELADLDEPYWPDTVWYGLKVEGRLEQLAMLYRAFQTPVLMAYGDGDPDTVRRFLDDLLPDLAPPLYAHLPSDNVTVAERSFRVTDHGLHIKMGLNIQRD
jgi:hypothetical protein